MSHHLKIIFVALFITLITGCGSYHSVNQATEDSYLLLVGKTSAETLRINNSAPLTLGMDTKSFNQNGKTVTKITLAPGTHTIIIERDGKTVIQRKIFVSEGNAFEVKL